VIIGAAGQLNPPKGFAFVDAAAIVVRARSAVFVLLATGPAGGLSGAFQARLQGKFVMTGFPTISIVSPNLDVSVMTSCPGRRRSSSECCTAQVPMVATSSEAYRGHRRQTDWVSVPSGHAGALADRIVALLDDDLLRKTIGRAAQARAARIHVRRDGQALLRGVSESGALT
jgi:hypothetical protein